MDIASECMDVPDQQTFITGLEDEIGSRKQALAQAKDAAQALEAELGNAHSLYAQADEHLQQLKLLQAAAVEQLARSRKDEAALHIALEEQARQLSAQHQAELEAARQRAKTAAQDVAAGRAEAEKMQLKAEDALAEYAEARSRAVLVERDLDERHQLLHTEYGEHNRLLQEATANASARSSAALIAAGAAERTANLARKSLDDIVRALAAAEQEIVYRQQALDSLYQQKEREISELRQTNYQDLTAAKAREDQAAAELADKRQEKTKAETLAAIAQKTYLATEEKCNTLAAELRELYAAAEAETAAITQKMEKALKRAVAEREVMAKISQAANRIDAQATKAIEKENQLRERISRLRAEDHDLNNAALVAKNLAADATASRLNADSDMLATLSEMEQALIAAALEAEQQARQKRRELEEAEAAGQSAFDFADKKRQSVLEAQRMLAEAKRNALSAEQSMYELSAGAGSNGPAGSNAKAINSRRAAYEEAVQEAAALKEAADDTGNRLRLVKNATERAERAFLEARHQANQALSQGETHVLELEESFSARISEAHALLNIAKDKREHLYTAQLQKREILDAAEEVRERKRLTADNRSQELRQLRAETKNALNSQKAKLDSIIRHDTEALQQTRDEALAAARHYDDCLLTAMRISDQILENQEYLQKTEAEIGALLQSQAAASESGQQQAEQSIRQAAADLAAQEQSLAELEDALRLAALNAEQAHKQQAQLRARQELYALRIQRHSGALAAAESEHAARIIAWKEQQAALAEAARLEQRREQQRRALAKEEAKQRARAQARKMAEEIEAAQIAAEAEAARLAAIERERQEKAEQDAMRLLAGEVLERKDNLMLLDPADIWTRLERFAQQAREQAKEQDFRWISPQKAATTREQAAAFGEQAAADFRLFRAAQTTLQSVHQQLTEKLRTRHEVGQSYAAAIYAVDHTVSETDALQAAYEDLRRSSANSRHKLLLRSLQNMYDTYSASAATVNQRKQELSAIEISVRMLDEEIRGLRSSYDQTLTLLQELAQAWIYNERRAITARAELAEIEREAADREQLRQQSQARLQAAREAAAAASAGIERMGSAARTRPAISRRRPRNK